MKLEDVTPGAQLTGITGDEPVTVAAATWIGGNAVNLTYRRSSDNKLDERILYRNHGAGASGGSMPGPVTAPSGGTPPVPPPPAAPVPKNTRFYGTVGLDPERFGRDLNRLYQEVIQHLAAAEDVELEITVEIRATKKDGFPDTTARIVSENARTLKFDQSGFEDH